MVIKSKDCISCGEHWIAGHWSADSESVCRRDSWSTAVFDDKTAYNDKDSAVSLPTNAAADQ